MTYQSNRSGLSTALRSTTFAAAAPYAALMTAISLCASGVLFVLLGRSALTAHASESPLISK